MLSIVLIVFLLILKLNEKKTLIVQKSEEQQDSSIQYETLSSTEEQTPNDGPIQLNPDETFITSVSSDLNEDSFLDEIIAIKKSLNPSIYLVLATQGPKKEVYKKVVEIKTNVLLPSSLSIDVIQLQKSLPAIVCSGIGLNREQTLSIYLIKEDKNNDITYENIASVFGDVQVQLQDRRTSTIGTLDDYYIETYNFSTKKENALSQIRTEYRWSARARQFIKTNEETLEEKTLTNVMLNDLKVGDIEAYKQYLSGLWYMPKTVGENVRYLYYNKSENNFIFHIGEIEEIYVIQNMFTRRYGFSIVAVNSSISTIKRHIEIDIKNIEEIRLRVSEDVASLKINTESNWNGLYRKKQNTFAQTSEEELPSHTELKTILSESNITWVSEDEIFKTSGSTYSFTQKDKEEKGSFNFIVIDGYNILQTKSTNNERSFYIVELERNEQNATTEGESPLPTSELSLKLKPCSLTFAKIETIDEKQKIFKELRE